MGNLRSKYVLNHKVKNPKVGVKHCLVESEKVIVMLKWLFEQVYMELLAIDSCKSFSVIMTILSNFMCFFAK